MELRRRGTALQAGARVDLAARLIPDDARRVRLTIDRTELLDSSKHNFVRFWLEISLNGGISWGGSYVDKSVRPPRSYPLFYSAGVGGGRHGIPGVSEDAFIEMLLPPGKGRLIRFRLTTSERADVGLKVDYS